MDDARSFNLNCLRYMRYESNRDNNAVRHRVLGNEAMLLVIAQWRSQSREETDDAPRFEFGAKLPLLVWRTDRMDLTVRRYAVATVRTAQCKMKPQNINRRLLGRLPEV